MKKIRLYNTLNRKIEDFFPVSSDSVGLYTCGPTVYNFAHLGNLRTFIFEDILKRVFLYNNLSIKHVMNITDVGHLVGDGDDGEDKLEVGAKREGKNAYEVADFFAKAFLQDLKNLNIITPDILPKATEHIVEQIDLIDELESKGFTYKTSDGIYFNSAKFPEYNKLSHLPLKSLQEGARVEKNNEKKNPHDFALWKFSNPETKRQMEWPSPWGVGFPGWHLECSAMSYKYLNGHLDIHCGGIDHINIHHTNEIAQSEAAGIKPFFNYWIHGEFLVIAGGKKMAKSDDNFLTLKSALIDRKIDPLVYRYACLQAHYRQPLEYSEGMIDSAAAGLEHLRNQVRDLGLEKGEVINSYKTEFISCINNDLNMPQALALVSGLLKDDISSADKLATILDFDRVFGLGLETKVPDEILALVEKREEARLAKDYDLSDKLRAEIDDKGYIVKDRPSGFVVYAK